jgi:hypothetical protein
VAESTRTLALVISGAATYLFFRATGHEGRDRGQLLFALAGSLVALYGLLQAAGIDFLGYSPESWMYRVVTTLGHRNFTAVYLVVSLLVVLDLSRRLGSGHRLILVAICLIYCGLLATGSRVPIAIATVALLRLLWLKTSARRAAIVAVILLCGWLGVIVARGELARVITRTETLEIRQDLYTAMLPLLSEQPLIGLGVGSFAHRSPMQLAGVSQDRKPELVFLHAHLLPAEIQIELGLVGLAASLVLLVPVYFRVLRSGTWRRSWLVWAHGAWLLTNLYDVNFFFYAGWVTLWPLLAWLRSEADQAAPVSSDEPASWFRRAVFAAPLLVVAATLILTCRSSNLSARAFQVTVRKQAKEAATLYQRAERVWPLPLQQSYRAAVATLDAGLPEIAERQLREVERRAAGFSAVRYNIGVALAQQQRHDEALIWIRSHLDLYPGDITAKEGLIRLVAGKWLGARGKSRARHSSE